MPRRSRSLVAVAAATLSACADLASGGGTNDQELITTVTLTFSPEGGGLPVVASWSDPEGDGDPTIDPIALAPSTTYDVGVTFLDALQTPVEDITEEVEDEADEHLVLFTGTAVRGPATGDAPDALVVHAYADTDAGGLPIGLANTFTVVSSGSGTLRVTLRHLPPEDGTAIKVAGLAEQVATGGVDAIGGDSDVDVTFTLTVP